MVESGIAGIEVRYQVEPGRLGQLLDLYAGEWRWCGGPMTASSASPGL